jgi:dihydroorotate dehydrogenase electron transfer subunit
MLSKIKDLAGKVKRSKLIGKDTVSMWVEMPVIKFDAGQFAMLECPGFPLRRPFVIADSDKNSLRFIFKIKGKGTAFLSNLSAGTDIKVLAPLGNSFPAHNKKTVPLLLGGGVGIVTMLPLAKKLHSLGAEPRILLGADTKNSLALAEELEYYGEVALCTDDGSLGLKCNVVELAGKYIKKRPGDYIIYACGPTPMLKSLSAFSKKEGLKCYVSIEEKMACGVGACVCCVVKTAEGMKRVCKDGPVFEAEYIKW